MLWVACRRSRARRRSSGMPVRKRLKAASISAFAHSGTEHRAQLGAEFTWGDFPLFQGQERAFLAIFAQEVIGIGHPQGAEGLHGVVAAYIHNHSAEVKKECKLVVHTYKLLIDSNFTAKLTLFAQKAVTLRSMKPIRLLVILLLAALFPAVRGGAQIIDLPAETLSADSLQQVFADKHYYFGLYKDNYFIFGPPIGQKPTKSNTNVKFQISIAQKLTKSTLPWGTYLYLYYSQKVFWNVLQNSMPMTDLNFNPGIGLTKPVFVKGKFVGKLSLTL